MSGAIAIQPTGPNQNICWDPEQIKKIDLKQFRNSNLYGDSYLLWLIPVIGWVALACLKYYYVCKHRSAEQVMKNFDSQSTDNEKIKIVAEAIKVSGPLAWQYRLEYARLQLLQKQAQQAANSLTACDNQRGRPSQSGRHNVRGCDLVYFIKESSDSWDDKEFVMKVYSRNESEALLRAAVCASLKAYATAYHLYNDAIMYRSKNQSILQKEDIRKYQKALVRAMEGNNQTDVSQEALNIINAESR